MRDEETEHEDMQFGYRAYTRRIPSVMNDSNGLGLDNTTR